MSVSVATYPLDNYVLVERESQPEEDHSVSARIARLEQQYAETGIRRSVEAIMVATVCGLPHVLVLQVANAFYKIPGGYLDRTEDEKEGLIRLLNEQLGLPKETGEGYITREDQKDWTVSECLGTWWRPHFDTFFYPYWPPQCSAPKECKKLFLVLLPPKKIFAVPQNMKLQAVPIYEFYDNAARYGPQFAGMPYWLSKFIFENHETKRTAAVKPLQCRAKL